MAVCSDYGYGVKDDQGVMGMGDALRAGQLGLHNFCLFSLVILRPC